MRKPIRSVHLLAGLSALLLSHAAQADDSRVDAQVNASYPSLLAVYKDLHQHPELGFQETRTAALLAKEMRSLGFKVTERVGGTGLVGGDWRENRGDFASRPPPPLAS